MMKLNDSQRLYEKKKATHIFSKFSEVEKVKLTKKYRMKFTKEISKEQER